MGPDVCRGLHHFPSSAAAHVTISSIDPRRQRGNSLFTHRVQLQARLINTVRVGGGGGNESLWRERWKEGWGGERVERDPSS